MSYFYHKTIEVYTGVFGSLFTDYRIKSNNKMVKVPIEFLAKNKSSVRSDYDIEDTKIKRSLPRIVFNLINWEKDTARQTNKRIKLSDKNYVNGTSVSYQYNRIPYIFYYDVSIKTKNISEMLQLIEQISVKFVDSLKIVIKDNDELNTETDVFVKLISQASDIQALGTFDDYRSVECTLQFSLEGYLYQRTNTSNTIQQVNIDLGTMDPDNILEGIIENV